MTRGMTEAELFAELGCVSAKGRVPALGVMGGTFDPVHCGHVAMADAAFEELGLDGMLYVPAGNPSFKQDRRLASPADRLRMVELAVGERPRTAVSTCEIDRCGVTYTSDTVAELAQRCPAGTRLVFVMGGDSLASLHLWHEVSVLVRSLEFAVAPRAGFDIPRALQALHGLGLTPRVYVLQAPVPAVSSTEVRRLVAQGSSEAAHWLDPAVARYIEEHGLYLP